MKAQDTIDRVKELLEQGHLSGVMDDRGKFIYISQVSIIKSQISYVNWACFTLSTSNVFFRKHINSNQYFQEEMESIAKFIKQRGRVSIAELAENSNKLISLNTS